MVLKVVFKILTHGFSLKSNETAQVAGERTYYLQTDPEQIKKIYTTDQGLSAHRARKMDRSMPGLGAFNT